MVNTNSICARHLFEQKRVQFIHMRLNIFLMDCFFSFANDSSILTLISLFHLQVSVYMPSLKIVRNVVDRMKNISNFVVRTFFSSSRICQWKSIKRGLFSLVCSSVCFLEPCSHLTFDVCFTCDFTSDFVWVWDQMTLCEIIILLSRYHF